MYYRPSWRNYTVKQLSTSTESYKHYRCSSACKFFNTSLQTLYFYYWRKQKHNKKLLPCFSIIQFCLGSAVFPQVDISHLLFIYRILLLFEGHLFLCINQTINEYNFEVICNSPMYTIYNSQGISANENVLSREKTTMKFHAHKIQVFTRRTTFGIK